MELNLINGKNFPAIVQDEISLQVITFGYINQEIVKKIKSNELLCLIDATSNSIWNDEEIQKNNLKVTEISIQDEVVLIKVLKKSSFDNLFNSSSAKGFIYELQYTIKKRIEEKNENSYTYKLTQRGINKVAQKVGEEAVELVIEAKDSNDDLFLNESADLMYHFLILLHQKGFTLEKVEEILKQRQK
jgi:phosphoribosyl-ATP pyrophosphohydrolase/phosphoribosyl-AMP cyclohydrolase